MTKSELVIIGKLINTIVKKEITPLIKEVKQLKQQLIVEGPPVPKQTIDVKQNSPVNKISSKTSPLAEILSSVTSFDSDESEEHVSILDTIYEQNHQNAGDPVSKVLHTLQNTDFRKTLKSMEAAAQHSPTRNM